jgi:hypothetical protein
MNAINDALKPFNAKVFAQPFTPERILSALGKVPARWPEMSAANYTPIPAAPPPTAGPASTPDKSGSGGLLGRMFGRK